MSDEPETVGLPAPIGDEDECVVDECIGDDLYFDHYRTHGWVHRGPIGSEPGLTAPQSPARPLSDDEYESRLRQGWLDSP